MSWAKSLIVGFFVTALSIGQTHAQEISREDLLRCGKGTAIVAAVAASDGFPLMASTLGDRVLVKEHKPHPDSYAEAGGQMAGVIVGFALDVGFFTLTALPRRAGLRPYDGCI